MCLMDLLIDMELASVIAQLPLSAAAAVLAAGPLVSPRVAAALTKRSGHVVRQAIANGSLPAGGTSHRYISLDDLSRWADRTFSPLDLRAVWRPAAPKERTNACDQPA
jgi:hypothetical protein